jgi:hypothetical protein
LAFIFSNLRNFCAIFNLQARHDSFRSAAPLPTPSAPKQQLPRKDAAAVNQPNTGVADLPKLEHSRDLHTIFSSAPSTTIPVTVKPSAGSIGEKVADSMRPNSSHGAEKGESPKHVRPSGEASSSHPERDSEICSEISLQHSKHDTESLVSKSLPVATNQLAVSVIISSEGLVYNPLSSALVSPSEESTVVLPNNEGRRREILGRSNSIKDHQKKIGKKGQTQNTTFMNPALSSLPVNKTGTQLHVVADLPNLEHSCDLHTIISSALSTMIPVTVEPSAGSIGEKVADPMQPNSSHGAEKGESPKHVRPSGEASSSHPERDSEICSESSLQLSKHDTEPLVSKSLTPVATNQSTVPAVISSEGLVSNPLSSALVSPLQTPSAPKQQLLRKDAGAVNQPNTGEAYPVPKAKKYPQVSPAPPASQQQKPPGLPMTGMSMPKPFQQSQVSVQYGGPDQQLQSQGMTAAASLQIPLHMPLAMGNPPQMGPPQLPPQLSSMGITMSPQYSQQQGGKFGVPRKTTVKITHPETREELRLDKRADYYSDGGSSGVRGRKKKNIKKYLKKKGEGCTLGLSLNDEESSASSNAKTWDRAV